MYHNNNRNRQQNFRRPQNGRGNRPIPKLDPRLYVKQAQLQEEIVQYVPKYMFNDFPVDPQLKQNIAAKGYRQPSPIQDQAIMPIIEGNDVIGLANTGTGKTAAFLIPLINKLLQNRNQKVLIIVPTRELAVQIEDELRGFARNMRLYSVLCIGGVSLHGQISGLRHNPQFVIGTPGRLKDLEQQRYLRFSEYNNIVLDEVDRMMDMGFIVDIKRILALLPSQRQSLFFSATMPDNIRTLAQSFLRNPVTVAIKSNHRTADTVEQDIIKLNGRNKQDVLADLLSQEGFEKVIVFGRTKWGMEKLAKMLQHQGFPVAAIHGNKSQNQRQRALNEFKSGRIRALLATDVASRGLDISDVTHVINYDEPASYEDYIHRIGRTGRANRTGVALTLID
jgi:ATP-dependent RNA helicase RhlE